MDHEPTRGPKKKKRLVLGSEMDEKIRDLYEKYVCSDLIDFLFIFVMLFLYDN